MNEGFSALKIDPQKWALLLARLTMAALTLALLIMVSVIFLKSSKLEMVLLIVCLPTCLVIVGCLSYLVAVRFVPETHMTFVQDGIFDAISVVRLGGIHREHLRKVRLVQTLFFGSCLEITIRSSASVWTKSSNPVLVFCRVLYRIAFSGRIYVPISMLGASREQIKDNIRRLNDLPKTEDVPKSGLRLEPTPTPLRGDFPPPPPMDPAPSLKDFEPREVTLGDAVPLVMESTIPVRDPKFDDVGRRVFKFFNEKIIHFPDWQKENTKRLPSGVEGVAFEQLRGREKIAFTWNEVKYDFSIDFESSEDFVTLSVQVDGDESLVVLLRREIGGYEYLEAQHFKDGIWISKLETLFEALHPMAARA